MWFKRKSYVDKTAISYDLAQSARPVFHKPEYNFSHTLTDISVVQRLLNRFVSMVWKVSTDYTGNSEYVMCGGGKVYLRDIKFSAKAEDLDDACHKLMQTMKRQVDPRTQILILDGPIKIEKPMDSDIVTVSVKAVGLSLIHS